MEFNDLTPEQKKKLDACKSPEEVLALAKEEGVELTEEQLDQITGGGNWYDFAMGKRTTCTNCNRVVEWSATEPNPICCPFCGAKFHFRNA